MDILHLTGTFGRLDHSELSLSPGLNVLYAPNETGKSTWGAFIRTMLYGLSTRERGPLADKNRYAPWTGAPMQGRMDLTTHGDACTLLRETRRAASPLGEFSCTYTGTGTPVPGITGQNAGEVLLGVPREVFERSAFIGQNALAVDQDAELERRIAALIITDEEKRVIAYHEAGHATVSWILENASPLIKVTIIPRGKALGAAWYLPEERQITTREQMMDELAATLGGRVSERLTFGEVSTGALNDLERVTKQAYAMVAYYGMSDNVGTLSYYDSTGQSDMSFTKPYSELTAQQIDAETKRVIGEAYAMAERVLTEHADGLKQLAELLLDREVVFTEDVERIFGKRKKDIERERREAGKKAAEGGEPATETAETVAVSESGAAKEGAPEDPADKAASDAKK